MSDTLWEAVVYHVALSTILSIFGDVVESLASEWISPLSPASAPGEVQQDPLRGVTRVSTMPHHGLTKLHLATLNDCKLRYTKDRRLSGRDHGGSGGGNFRLVDCELMSPFFV